MRVGLLHGRMKNDEKESVMEKFRRGEIQILVATTVIEVGVDVPNATVMVIEHADRFGLAQLHQLRGRIGRGSEKSHCILVAPKNITGEARERIETMVATTNGFEIAERDLKQRGPGEFFGTRQHGDAGVFMLRSRCAITNCSNWRAARRLPSRKTPIAPRSCANSPRNSAPPGSSAISSRPSDSSPTCASSLENSAAAP